LQTDWSRDSSIWAQFKSYLWRIGPLCMLDRKWRQSRDRKRPCPEVCSAHAQPFSPEVTKSRDWKRPCPALPFSRIFPRTIFPYFFWNVGIYIIWIFLIMFYLEHKDFKFKKKIFDGPCTAQKNQKMHIWNYMHKRMEILHIN
jgi:hypothetical protein